MEAQRARTRSRRIAAVALTLAVAAAGYYTAERYRYHAVRTDAELLRFLPQNNVTQFYAAVATLRRAGYLNLVSRGKSKQAPEYLDFVRETGFDYTRDADALAGAADSGQWWFLVRGRFNWSKLQGYARRHGGDCRGRICSVPSSTPGRWASYWRVQPDVMALAVSTDSDAADRMHKAEAEARMPTDAPVWIEPAHRLLTNPNELPLGLRLFAISLGSADSVLVSLRQPERREDAMAIEVDAVFANQPTAETAKTQLENDTNLAKAELAREHKPVDPADLTGLLTAGAFRAEQRHMTATWPVSWALLKSLE